MRFYNIKHPTDQVSFSDALMYGLGRDDGLFFPKILPVLTSSEIDSLLNMDFITRSVRILSLYIGDEMSQKQIFSCVASAFSFSVPVLYISKNISVLELFHGPTLAFKDFGARLMAQILMEVNKLKNLSMTILTATSGDTGAAVAHAFYGIDNIRVIILYPENKVSSLQEKLFCTLGSNIYPLAVNGDFDACQLLVKKAFNDNILRKKLFLNSANSINICRLLAQICYYFEGVAQLPNDIRKKLVISVPSGNFGNLTAGLLAKSLGLPVKRFIIATNINDTVPRFLDSGLWDPHSTISTLSNAMDVSQPNNWPRVEALFQSLSWSWSELSYGSVNDVLTCETIRTMLNIGYLIEPHSAIAYYVLSKKLQYGEFGLFLGTAHPVKFKESIENILKNSVTILLPNCLKKRNLLPILSVRIPNNFSILRELLLDI